MSVERIRWVIEQVRGGTATPHEAISLLKEFVRQARAGRIDQDLVDYVAETFSRFLAENPLRGWDVPSYRARAQAALLKGLGLRKESRGRQAVDESERVHVALAILELRLEGRTLDEAVQELSGRPVDGERFGPISASRTRILDHWKRFKAEAAEALRIQRMLEIPPRPLSPEERERIEVIVGRAPRRRSDK
jgi:hypothetical protein